MLTISASTGGLTTPSETASAMETINSAPLAWAISAMAGISSMMPKKLGLCTSTAAVSSVTAASNAARSTRPVLES